MDTALNFFSENEAAHTGPCKLLRTISEYGAAIEADHFLGIAWCFDKPRRIESNELVSFIGEFETGYYGEQIFTSVEFVLKIPKIPKTLLDLIVTDFKSHPSEERIFQIRWDILAKEYVIVKPTQFQTSKCAIEYAFSGIPPHLKPILEIHSHNTMPAYFSKTDDTDEILHGFYGVVGTVDTTPTMRFRVGMEGAFSEVTIDSLFDFDK